MMTVDDLLDFIEDRVATHTPDFSECDCYVCNMYGHICHYYNVMQEA